MIQPDDLELARDILRALPSGPRELPAAVGVDAKRVARVLEGMMAEGWLDIDGGKLVATAEGVEVMA